MVALDLRVDSSLVTYLPDRLCEWRSKKIQQNKLNREILYSFLCCCSCLFERPHDKTKKLIVRPAKTQISLGIRPIWSESSLCARWVAKDPSFLHADREDSDQTGRMPRLIWVFAGCTCHFVGFVMRRLRCSYNKAYTEVKHLELTITHHFLVVVWTFKTIHAYKITCAFFANSSGRPVSQKWRFRSFNSSELEETLIVVQFELQY